jgi:2-(1,2-epoxy-1,2-dihydrophenyl)acetyl-CoA isomerase
MCRVAQGRDGMRVRAERAGPAAVVTIDDPATRNALDPELATEIAAAVGEAAGDPGVCGVVLTGRGAFCSGANLKGVIDRTGMPAEQRRALVYGAYQAMIRAVLDIPVPIFAAVDGPAIGMGLDLALACDAVLVGPGGWLHQGWGRIGLVPATGGELLLRRRNPLILWKLLEEMPRLDGPEAERLGLAEAVEGETALARTVRRVTKLAELSRPALEAYVELSRAEIRAALGDHQKLALDHQLGLLASPDFRRRVQAVLP